MRRRGIALFLRSLDNDYQQRLRDDALAAAQRHGFDLTVLAARNEPNLQAEQIEQSLVESSHGPREAAPMAVLVSPVRDEELGPQAQSAARDGIGWVLLNREGTYLDGLRAKFPEVPVFSVTPDQFEIGRNQAEQAKLLLRAGGSILYLTGPLRTSSAKVRHDGMTQGLGPEHSLTTLEADWTTEGARLALDAWLAEQPPSAAPHLVCAQNDEMALGARQALRDVASRSYRADLSAVPITGCDGSPGFGQKLVKEKRLSATISSPSAAGPAIEWLAKWRDGLGVPPAHVTLPVASFPDLAKLKRLAA